MIDPAVPRAAGAVDTIRELNAELADAFVGARSIIESLGPIDRKNRELIMVAGFTSTRIEAGFRVHARRALEAGASTAELRQAVTLMLFSTQGIAPIASALHWAEDVIGAYESPS